MISRVVPSVLLQERPLATLATLVNPTVNPTHPEPTATPTVNIPKKSASKA